MTKDLRNKLLSQVFLAASQAAFPLVTYPIITKALGPGGIGKVVFIDSWVQMLVLLAGLGIPLYGIREIAKQKDDQSAQSKIFSELFILQVCTMVPAALVLFIMGKWFSFDPAFLALALVSLAGSALSSEWYLQGKERFVSITIRTILIRLLTLAFIVLLVKKETDVYLYYALLVGSVILTTVFNLVSALSAARFMIRELRIFRHLKKINWVYGCYLLFSFYSLIDSVVLGMLSTEAAVGAYSLGYRLIRLSTLFIISLGVVFIPKISYYNQTGQQEALQKETAFAQQLIFFFSLPFGCFFFVMAPEIVGVFATNEFSSTVDIIRIGSLVPLLLSISHFAGIQVMLPMNKEKTLFVILAGSCLINLLLNFSLVPHWQEKGTAIANLSTEFLIALASIYFLVKRKLIQFYWKHLILNLILASVVFPIGVFFRQTAAAPLFVLLYTGIATAIFFAGVHWFFIKDTMLKKLLKPTG